MKSNILILGAGQLALLLVEASFNISTYINKIYIYTDKKTNCCNNINCEYMEVIIDNYENINKIADKCNIITYDYESYSIDIFNSNNKTKIFPSVTILEIIQDKYKQKMYMLDNNINTPKFTYVNSYNDMINFINIHNYPVFLKNRKGSFDGRGNHLIKNKDDLEHYKNIKPNIYIVEEYIEFNKEVSLIGCINSNNEFVYYDVVENKHKNSILVETIFPDINISSNIKNNLITIFKSIIDLFNTRGIICVEFFIKNELIYFNECCLRVHNSGHYTINASYTSQFENHLRSILNINLGYTKNIFSGIFYNIISNLQTLDNIEEKINYKKYKHFIKYYNKEPINIRKIGHIVINTNNL